MVQVVHANGAHIVMAMIAVVGSIGLIDTFGGVVRNSVRRVLRIGGKSEGDEA